jgi:hypothetical protein
MTSLAKSCGKGNVHNLEPEDLRALILEASAFTGVPLRASTGSWAGRLRRGG